MKSRHIFTLQILIYRQDLISSALGLERMSQSLRCYRRSTGGKSIFNQIKLLTEHCGSKILCPCNRKVIKKIEIYIPKPKALSMCLINVRSCNNKTALMKHFINDLDLDICAITET